MEEIPQNIGWIGLGLMGLPMAKNILEKTHSQLFVYDVVQKNVDKLVNDGQGRVYACGSSREVADKSDLILSMVPEGSHVRSVYLDFSNGVLISSLGTKVLIDCSTIDTTSSLEVRDSLAGQHKEARFYDAPVSGGVIGAEKGTLTFMVGAAEDCQDWALLKSVLHLMGGNIFACGGASLGLTAKLCNNYCSGLIAIAVSEVSFNVAWTNDSELMHDTQAMNIGIRSNMDPRILANIFHTSTAQSAICDDWNPVPGLCPNAPGSNGYKGGFRVELMKKDFALAVDTAKKVGAELALAEKGLEVYDGASKDGKCKGLDSRVVYRYLGGEEDWREKGNFPDVVGMKRDETRDLLKGARMGKQ